MINEKRYTVIDLFAGCGGLSLGLYQSGWDGLFAIEKNSFAFATLKANLIDNKKHFNWPDWLPQTPHDINEVLKKYTPQLKNLRGTVDLVAGGPPCQGFSMAGKRVEEDIRNSLVFSYITPVRDKGLFRIVPIAYSFQCARAVPRAYSRRNSMQPMPHRDS